jgi:phosphatidylglycerophosphate synthase
LASLGATDWIDGFVARRWHQVSNVGKILDPVADRTLGDQWDCSPSRPAGGVPWWFASAHADARTDRLDVDRRAGALGAARIDVLWWGKVSTFALMVTYPLFLLTTNPASRGAATWQHLVRDVTG